VTGTEKEWNDLSAGGFYEVLGTEAYDKSNLFLFSLVHISSPWLILFSFHCYTRGGFRNNALKGKRQSRNMKKKNISGGGNFLCFLNKAETRVSLDVRCWRELCA